VIYVLISTAQWLAVYVCIIVIQIIQWCVANCVSRDYKLDRILRDSKMGVLHRVGRLSFSYSTVYICYNL
jgi:hypothetical protein